MTLTGARAATVPSAESPAARRGRRPLAWAFAAAGPVAVAAVLATGLGVATVQNDSMSPTLRGGDTVVFDRWSSAPARGDVVLLVDREGWSGTPDALLVKRVVGVEGDVVVCCEAGTGRLVVNGQPVDEPYAPASRPGGDIPFRVTVPEDAVWVMGDNRAASADSRLSVSEPGHGGVPLADLRGVARLWWS